MRPQLLHLSGPLRGHTVTYDDPFLEIGSQPGIDLRIVHEAVAARHAVIEYSEPDCAFLLRAVQGQVFVNRQEVREVILQDDDLIEWGLNGPRCRFRMYVPPGRVCKPVRRMLKDARLVRRESGRASAARGFARDLLTQATPQLKVGVPLLVALLGLPLAYLAGWLGSRPAAAQQRADDVALAEIRQLREQQRSQAEELARVLAAGAVTAEIQKTWSRGVCLVHGVVTARFPDGRPARSPGGSELRGEYTGSGFLATRDGRVLTNRHVMTPWETMPQFDAPRARGARPEFLRLTATFPGHAPVAIAVDSIVRHAEGLDLAMFRLAARDVRDVPVLPLHEGPLEELTDRRAIVVGYPTGLSALLAKAEPALVDELQAARADMATVIDRLAGADRIRPTITQGIVGSIEDRMLVYDASTTHGGSGGPVFGGDGTVIAVNYAILRDFAGANFGVPIRFGRAMLGL